MTNTIVTYTHNPAAYKSFAKFNTLKALNTAFEMWLADHKGKFGKKELQALKTLIRHSAKVAGIATIKFKSLVKVAKEKFDYIFDVRTAKRAVAKAKTLGMLRTLETRKGPKKLKGPSIYVWQPYKCKNVPTTNHEDQVQEDVQKCDEIKPVVQSQEMAQPSQARGEMSPPKSINTKANIIKLLNTYTCVATAYKSIAKKLKVKVHKEYKLLTTPVKPIYEVAPLKFHSRLKQTIYNNLMNNKGDVQAITEMIYGKVYSYTKFPVWQSHKETMLEHSLRVVEVCLEAHKNGQLAHIKSIRGYINHKLNEELTAYVEYHLEKLLPQVEPSTSQAIIDLYGQAVDAQKAYREAQLDLYYR